MEGIYSSKTTNFIVILFVLVVFLLAAVLKTMVKKIKEKTFYNENGAFCFHIGGDDNEGSILRIYVEYDDKKKEPEEELEDVPEEEVRGEYMSMGRLGYCGNCEKEFSIAGDMPAVCPHCGIEFHLGAALASDESERESYTCPHCGGRFEMLDGDVPDYCPYCGMELEDIEEDSSSVREPYHVCTECGQEFRLTEGRGPVRCPYCGTLFAAGEVGSK